MHWRRSVHGIERHSELVGGVERPGVQFQARWQDTSPLQLKGIVESVPMSQFSSYQLRKLFFQSEHMSRVKHFNPRGGLPYKNDGRSRRTF